ncbi:MULTISPECIES: flagellar hook capping FlgD N-terminal domain-containing protein [unclassified Methylobacterium]|uniref:flagellar hook assembly protein FlgD n=1 Tax=unclassified Methylobacterium TaxID=2615210 RepID=UPI0008ECD90C|nr:MULTISPECIES: flagellar hook capping FlgD N-terminal domain-containing protein [unclassified Methylobacterium]AWN51279.1 flagellar hook capping protein [Methylobacterium sp. 17Sr1-1]SFU56246.1 flagellar basal-body rod modification protein FlgD [Methylobacterium sp. 174MFSha1.1]
MTAGISSLTSLSTASTGAKTGSDASTIAGNFNQFLTLLTTQLQNQNPLDPLDTNQFTQQLVQFASVEQQLKTNDQLGSLITASKASAAATASGLIGKTVTADGATTSLAEGAATWTLNPARAAAKAVMTITDAKGNVVATQTKALPAGSQSFTWDGRASTGQLAADGKYTLKVQALDATGSSVAVDTKISGAITSVDVTGAEPVLTIGDRTVALSSVEAIGGTGGN